VRTDCHQHLWPEALVQALRERRTPPRLDGWTLHLDGEPPYAVRPEDHDPAARAERERDDGTERALVSLSSPLGIEHLPPAECAPLLDAWHHGAAALGAPFGVWAAAGVVEPDPAAAAKVLAGERVVGLQLPATAMAEPAAVERLGPLLDVLERAGKPLLVHPGPAAAPAGPTPPWWPAVVPYVAQLHAAWHAWHVAGRAAHSTLRVAFVALAGLAPLHHERMAARGGALGRIDPGVFYETSSYGTRAIDATVRVVGVDALVLGSDRPYAEPVEPGFGPAFTQALTITNPGRLTGG
jgi:6-methylsalicylate decarboxylase